MLRLATYNVLNLFDGQSEADKQVLANKVEFLAARIIESGADVVGLQEIGSEKLLEDLVLSLGVGRVPSGPQTHASYMHRVVGTPDVRGIRNALISRLPFKSSRVLTSPQLEFPRFVEGDPSPFGARLPLRRGVVHAEVDAGDLGSVDVLVVHFKSGRGVPLRTAAGEPIAPLVSRDYGEATVRALVFRAAESLFVRGAVDDLLADPKKKVAVVGDFNDVIDSVPVRIVRGGGPTLLQSCAELVSKEKRYTVMHNGDRKTIDHILVSPEMRNRLKNCSILNELLHDHDAGYTDVPRADSDHALVVASFE
ncbi:MAG: endonuclease/exonuclease/phosphatase family protein [Polyangiaceae bacterium]